MKYTILVSLGLYLQALLASALLGASHEKWDRTLMARDESAISPRDPRHAFQRYKHIRRAADTWSQKMNDGSQHGRRDHFPISLERSTTASHTQHSQPEDANRHPPYDSLAQRRYYLNRRNSARKALLASKKLASKKHPRRRSTGMLAERNDPQLERDSAPLARRSELNIRSPKPHKKSKLQGQVDSSKKLLNKDFQLEQKNQNKATQKALGGVNKAENHAAKEVQDEISRAKKYQGQDQQRIAKAQAQLAKLADDKGRSGKAGKKYQKALSELQKDQEDLVKLKQKGAASMARINAQEQKDFGTTQSKLAKAMDKAHSDQFDANGQAKVHLSKWGKFKKVMKKIGTGLEWAATGLSMLIPGAEEFGVARMAVQAGRMIAEKVGKKVGTKEAEKAMKKGGKDAAEQMIGGKMVNVVDAAKTESQAQIMAAKQNAQAGEMQVTQKIGTAAMPAANAALNKQLYGRYVSEQHIAPVSS